MLFRQLEYFVAVAKEKHFARAADACYVSQPALSIAIAKLERELNVTLINRGHNFEGLTPEGERLVVRAKRILAEHDAFKAEVAVMQSGITGTPRLGTGPTVSTTTALPVAAFCAMHPLARVKVCSRLSSTELVRQLRAFELDAAIAHFGPEDRDGLDVVPLYQEQYVLLTSGDRLVPPSSTVTWAEAARLPLALLSPDMRFRQFIDGAFDSAGASATPPGGDGLRRLAVRPCRHGRVGERRPAHLAGRHAGDGRDQGGPTGRARQAGPDHRTRAVARGTRRPLGAERRQDGRPPEGRRDGASDDVPGRAAGHPRRAAGEPARVRRQRGRQRAGPGPQHHRHAGAAPPAGQRHLGVMGIGMGYAIAAAVETGDPVVAIEGDSAFGFSGMEIEAVCRYHLPVVTVVLNNSGVYRGDAPAVGGDPAPTVLKARHDLMIQAFGGKGYRATTPAEVAAALREALAAGAPALIDCVIDPTDGTESGRIAHLNPKGITARH